LISVGVQIKPVVSQGKVDDRSLSVARSIEIYLVPNYFK